MSGFAGVIRLDERPLSDADSRRVRDAIEHRGGDGSGNWSDARATLMHAMLQTTPESLAEPQPHRDGDLAITADLRIDNRAELGFDEALGDAALVLAAYRRWGGECVRHLEGDFAFAIWNAHDRTLFCARDPFGVKPLVYAHLPDKLFAFASEVRALLAIEEMPRQVDEERVAGYLSLYFDNVEQTFFRAIKRLPGGCTLTLRDGVPRVTRYWSPDHIRAIRPASDAEYAEGFREHLVRAVRERMRVTRPSELGAMLSGGLDSSAIACVARDESSAPLPVFSWIFSDALDADEREFQEIVAREGGMVRHVIDSAKDDYTPWTDLEQLLPDGPPYATNFYLNHAVAQRARQLGIRAILDGLGGDSSISRGGPRFVELFVRGRLPTLIREMRAFASINEGESSVARVFRQRVVAPLLPPQLLKLRRRAADPWQRILKGKRPDKSPFRPHLSVRAEHHDHLRSPMMAEGLELFDRVMALSRTEGRYPFFDRKLVEYCVSLPSDQKLAGGYSRVVARRAMHGIVPDAIRWRAGKGKPGLHVVPALRASRDRLDDILLRDPSVLAPYVDVDVVRGIARDFLEGRGANPFLTGVRLWTIAAAGFWLRQL
ncbi:MAG TPA: asparagine synthase-related protein [Thermoanaerobaculia bacterium]|jgi:asparagine synthase (glutamine-hydrolysing)|nr:asparagine synthase-related protein [Thermoanaerobaculia bacterium]